MDKLAGSRSKITTVIEDRVSLELRIAAIRLKRRRGCEYIEPVRSNAGAVDRSAAISIFTRTSPVLDVSSSRVEMPTMRYENVIP